MTRKPYTPHIDDNPLLTPTERAALKREAAQRRDWAHWRHGVTPLATQQQIFRMEAWQ